MNYYSNVPYVNLSSRESTVDAFDNYYTQAVEIDPTVLAAMSGYFSSRGFSKTSSENIALIIIKQARQDNYNPMKILDSLKGLDSVELSGLVSEILNYNRFKTSSLGYAQEIQTNLEIKRNIIL